MATFDPRSLIGRIYVGATKHHYIQSVSSLPYGFREEEFRMFFSYTALYNHMTPSAPPPTPPPTGCGQFGAQVYDWQDLSKGPLNIATH